jgi:hypothetical protein
VFCIHIQRFSYSFEHCIAGFETQSEAETIGGGNAEGVREKSYSEGYSVACLKMNPQNFARGRAEDGIMI